MKKHNLIYFLALIVGFIFTVDALAQAPGRGRRGAGRYAMYYNPGTVVTVSATVTAVNLIDRGNGMKGIRLTVDTAEDKGLTVHVGPVFYLESKNVAFNKGDNLTITGSVTNFNGVEVLIAGQIIKGETTLALRDETGRPLWRGSGRGLGMGRGPGVSPFNN